MDAGLTKRVSILISFALLGCAAEPTTSPVYVPQQYAPAIMTRAQAETVVKAIAGRVTFDYKGTTYLRTSFMTFFRPTKEGIEFDVNGQTVRCNYSDLQPVRTFKVFRGSGVWLGDNCDILMHMSGASAENEVVQAINTLKSLSLGRARYDSRSGSDEMAFREAVVFYRSQQRRPQLPEEARRYRIQAESAFKAKEYDRAVDLYKQALRAAPWWPDGYLNRALLLGDQLGYFVDAIDEMRRYLELEPSGKDARAAQDKIYEWEGRVK